MPIGASDVSGFGSSVPCFPYTDCPSGTGYAFGRSAPAPSAELYSDGDELTVFRRRCISRPFQDLGRQYGKEIFGNFIEGEMPFIPADATLVTIFAGANDVNVITAALGGGAGGSGDPGGLHRPAGQDISATISRRCWPASAQRRVRPHHRVEPAEHRGHAVLAPQSPLPERQAAQRASVRMTTTVINTLPNVTVVDLMCDPRMYQTIDLFRPTGFIRTMPGTRSSPTRSSSASTLSSYPAPQNQLRADDARPVAPLAGDRLHRRR